MGVSKAILNKGKGGQDNGYRGKAGVTEAKSSQTAPLTPNQKVAFPEIAQTGATVIGSGKSPFIGGTLIPPTQVNIIRPK